MGTPPILVLGATGSSRRRVAAHLRALGAPVRSASRHSATRFRTLTEDGHAGRSYELTGPQALSFAEVCSVIEDVTGHPMRFHGSEDAYRAAQTSLGRSGQAIERDIASYAALRGLGDTEPLDTVPRLIGRPARTFRQYVTAAVADGSWPRSGDTTGTP
ncbi:hypothetical protein [Streptomyces sp. NPDC001153]